MARPPGADLENAMSIMKLLRAPPQNRDCAFSRRTGFSEHHQPQNQGSHHQQNTSHHHHHLHHHHHHQSSRQQLNSRPDAGHLPHHMRQQGHMNHPLELTRGHASAYGNSFNRSHTLPRPSCMESLSLANNGINSKSDNSESRGNGAGRVGRSCGPSDNSHSGQQRRSSSAFGSSNKSPIGIGQRHSRPAFSKSSTPSPCDDVFVPEPSDCKSPKEEGRMVSPSSCMPVLPMGSGAGSGDGSAGSASAAHLQAATSTTPEAGAGPGPPQLQPPPPHFLLDAHAGLAGSGPGGSAGGSGSMGPGQPMMKQEVAGTVPGSSMQSRRCQVCDDNASGFHYGVWSCEGCKAFFKRSIQGPVDYVCPATNTCTIDKHRRKSCQACRLRKCYEVGMNKGSQRKERKNSSAVNVLKGKRCRADSSDAAVNSTNNGGASSSKAARRSRSASILEALQRAELPVIESHHNHNEPATRVHLLNTVVQLADKELIYLINWAKTVPGYSDLIMGDQVHLIENCWLEMLWLNYAFRSMEHEGRTLVFAPDFHLDRQQWEMTGMGDVLEQVSAVSEQMVHYGLNKEEMLLLQATVLVNAEVRRLGSNEKIQEMRQTILDAFMEVVGRPPSYGMCRHAPSILLLLTHIRQASERGITFFQRLKMEGSVNFCDLITEMLDAHNPSGERRRQLQQQQHHLHHLHHHHLQQQHPHGGPPQHQHHQPPPPQQQHHQQQQQQALHTPQHQPPVHLHQPPPHARHQMAPE